MTVFLTLLFGCASEPNPDINTVQEHSVGERALSIEHNGVVRDFILYVPSQYDSAIPTPLFFNFHGFGGTSEGQMQWVQMNDLADQENFILVFPQGTDLDGSSHWNAADMGGDNKSDAEDKGFVIELIEQIGRAYNVDEDRVYAAGYSNGGFFSYYLACTAGEHFAAIASVSGTHLDLGGSCNPGHPMGMINLHGTQDGVVPYSGGEYYTSTQDVVDWWVNYNGAQTTPEIAIEESGRVTIEQYVYPAGENGVSIEHYKFIGGEHVWFEELFNGRSSGELIWDYVSQYNRSGRIE